MTKTWPARHIHLDFHTSEMIPDVGARFNRTQFQEALRLGHANHITLFAKCHHSWCYYPTVAGQRHPSLKPGLDLLGEQLAACRELGIRAPIYYTVGWSSNDAEDHPEWCCRLLDGSFDTTNFDIAAKPGDRKPFVSWKKLCPNSPGYRKLMLDQTREIAERYAPVDGFFYDICFFSRCYCAQCRADMLAAGIVLDDTPASIEAATRFYTGVWEKFFLDCRAIIHGINPAASVFFNGRSNTDSPPELLALQTHYELEDLPTTWGGYDKFPPRAKFFGNHDNPRKVLMAMSGKFHTCWGEFGGFKHPDAMRFEAACMIAFGARCSFGDQLHPSGEMDLETYRGIGQAYRYVEKIEPYGLDGVDCATLGVLNTGTIHATSDSWKHDQGVANMLLETHRDWEAVHPTGTAADWQHLETIILTGHACLDDSLAAKLATYVADGGSLLVLGDSALDIIRQRFVLDVGAEFVGESLVDMDYLVVADSPLATSLPASPFLNYRGALRSLATDGEILAQIKDPYFSRTYGHYCSHRNTCNRLENAAHPGAIRKGRVVFLPHPLGMIYHDEGARVHRQVFSNALDLLHRHPRVEAELPSAARINLVHQPEQHRFVLHLLYATPHQRGECLVVEDLPVLRDIALRLRLPVSVTCAWDPLTNREIPFTATDDASIQLVLPELQAHGMVVLEYTPNQQN